MTHIDTVDGKTTENVPIEQTGEDVKCFPVRDLSTWALRRLNKAIVAALFSPRQAPDLTDNVVWAFDFLGKASTPRPRKAKTNDDDSTSQS